MSKKPIITHQPVLLSEVSLGLSLKKGETLVDATLGEGGHAEALGALLGKKGTLVGFELDPGALATSTTRLSKLTTRKIFFPKSYREMGKLLPEASIKKVDAILFDLGLGSHQLSAKGRGFSFQSDEPLLMRFDAGPGLSARDLINAASAEELTSIISGYGGERYASRIAKDMVAKRKENPIATTKELRDLIWQAVPAKARHRRLDPATKTFQALRMAVNDELSAISEGLATGFQLLNPGGRMAVISFHSLEDGIVKRFFKEKKESGEGELYNKKPITASASEIVQNPRSRSAKLRIIKKL
jgi:16S rRNA (cytosine1402-N4)-methyltransferase